jgi:hypothetical protein
MTEGDLGNPHISFSEMWGLPKGRITGNPSIIGKVRVADHSSRAAAKKPRYS